MTVGLLQINVTDAAKAHEFYIDTLGFPVKTGTENMGITVIDNPGGAPILLYPVERSVAIDYPNQTGTTMVFHVEDVEKTHAEWSARGVEFIRIGWSEEESGIAPCPFGRFIAFKDPFGNVHEILQPY
jgi:catechol 2,3-dioxygenase-like lactoylglutathione lyase family enzyme